jgi:hypothetical protein
MWTWAETVLAVGLVTVVIGGALSPFVLIGLLGCLLLLIGLAVLATGAVIARNRTISVGRGVSGVVLLWTAAIGLIITTFGLCEIALDKPGQALQILPAVFGLSDWLMYLAASLILAGMFACGLRVAANSRVSAVRYLPGSRSPTPGSRIRGSVNAACADPRRDRPRDREPPVAPPRAPLGP